MHVAIDAQNLLIDRRGIATYVRAIASRWLQSRRCDITLLVRGPWPGLAKRNLAAQLSSERFAVSTRVPKGADVVWHPWNGSFFLGGARNLVTMHDVAPFAFPDPDQRKRQSQQEPFERSAATADRIVTDSTFSRHEIVRHLHVLPDRIAVVPLAAEPFYSPGDCEPLPEPLHRDRYILYVGALDRSKNVATLIDAWRDSLRSSGIALAIVGSDPAPDDVVAFGNLSIEELRNLYRGALCLAFPSLYEGFGLPPLEAMACGTPALVSRAASLPEVCGDAALYVEDARSVQAWAAALSQIANDESLRARLSQSGRAQAATFSWDRTADETYALLCEAAS